MTADTDPAKSPPISSGTAQEMPTVHSSAKKATHASASAGRVSSATCWITSDGDTLYASNAGSGTVSAYRDNGGGNLTALGNTATDAGTVDATVSADGKFLYAETGGAGVIDAFRISPDGSLTKTGAVAIPGGAGAEGIVAP